MSSPGPPRAAVQLFLGDTLDTEHIDAGYDAGVLTLRIPIAEKAKPRKISISKHRQRAQADRRLNPAAAQAQVIQAGGG